MFDADQLTLLEHVTQAHGFDQVFLCYFCSQSFATYAELDSHIDISHGQANILHGQANISHEQSNSPNNSNRCGMCSAKFTFASSLDRHMMKAHCNLEAGKVKVKWQALACVVCGSTFAHQCSLIRHVRKFYVNDENLLVVANSSAGFDTGVERQFQCSRESM